MDLFKLIGKVAVDTSATSQSLAVTDENATAVAGSIKSLPAIAEAAIAAVLAGVTAAGKKIFELASDTATRLDDISDQAQNMNVGTDWYQEWAYIASICGTDMGKIAASVETLTKKVGDGSKETESALNQLGIGLEEAQSMAPEDLYELVITRLSEITDPAVKASLASDLLGGSWKDLGTVMKQSGEDISGLKESVHALNGVTSEEDMEKAGAFKDALTNWNTAVTGLKNALGVEIIPAMTSLIEWLTKYIVPPAWIVGAMQAGGGLASAGWDIFANHLLPDQETIRNVKGGILQMVIGFGNAFDLFSTHSGRTGKFASGLDYVPYDDYPAMLHTGEAVLTAREAEQWRQDQDSPPLAVTQYITVNSANPGQIVQASTAALERIRRKP